MNQMAIIAHDLPPAALAQQYFRDGGELADNPYPKGSQEHECFKTTMAKLQAIAFQLEQSDTE